MTSKANKAVPAQEKETKKPNNRRALWIAIVVVVCLIIAGAAYYLTRDKEVPDVPTVSTSVPIAISGLKVPGQTKIGIVVTFGSGGLGGTQWNLAAQGARVAQQRLALGGTDVELVSLNDQGTPEGAKKAVAALVDEGVSGIIMATSGPQVEDAVSATEQAGIPTILPYGNAPSGNQDSWSLYPSPAEFDNVLAQALDGYANTLLIDAGEQISEQIVVSEVLTFTAGQDPVALAEQVAQGTGADVSTNGAYFGGDEETAEITPPTATHDAVLISGPPELQAKIVHALQTKNVSVPIVLTQSATSPGFATALFEAGGTIAPNLITVGTAGGESIALQKTEYGQSMSAFFAALRAFSTDKEILNLTEEGPFGNSAAFADSVSHDAVLALVNAAAQAKDNDPAKVAESLTSLKLTPGNGIAGLSIDYGTQPSPSMEEVSVLHATAQDLGLRGKVEDGSQSLVWFPQP